MSNSIVPTNVPVWDSTDGMPVTRPSFPRLTRSIEADVCIVGLGGSGLACITELLRAGVEPQRIVGLDAAAVGSGAAGRNGGFLLAGTAAFHHDAIGMFGHDRARRLYELTIAQIDEMAIETPDAVRRTGSLRIAASDDERLDCAAHLDALRADGFPGEWYDGPEGLGILVPTDCAFDPLRRVRTLACRVAAGGVRLFEGSPAVAIDGDGVATSEGRVRCEHVIVAADGRLGAIFPELRSRIRDVRLQMLATASTAEISLPRPVYARWGYDYWQQLPDGRLVLGGFRDQGGESEWTTDASPTDAVQDRLERFLREGLRVHAPITHRWAASVTYSGDGLPVLGEVRPRLIAAGAYSGTGNVLGALCGRAAARLTLSERPEMVSLLAA